MAKTDNKPAETTELSIEELKAMLAQRDAELAEKNTALEQAAAAGQKISLPVPGVFELKGAEDADGNAVSKKYRFKPGRTKVVIDGGVPVSSAALLRIANGEKATEQELKDYPALNSVTQAQATERLTKLVKIGASMLEEVAP